MGEIRSENMVELKIYTPDLHDEWNRFVANSKNATFLHNREYMDYHSDRFEDCSLVAYSKGKIIALLPANRVGETLYSHQGLTYGGWLMPLKHFYVTDMMEIFDEMSRFLPSIGVKELIYKAIPHIYHSYPAEEDLYAIFRYNGTLIETNVSTTIPQENPFHFNDNYRNLSNIAKRNGIEISESDDYVAMWKMLTERLDSKYGAVPVHSLDEILLLKGRFLENMRLFVAKKDGELVAGCVIYDTKIVAHSQYTASTIEGRDIGALPLLYRTLIENVFKKRKYFDFGISNEDHGRYLNTGLVMQKNYMGGRAIVYNTYKIVF